MASLLHETGIESMSNAFWANRNLLVSLFHKHFTQRIDRRRRPDNRAVNARFRLITGADQVSFKLAALRCIAIHGSESPRCIDCADAPGLIKEGTAGQHAARLQNFDCQCPSLGSGLAK